MKNILKHYSNETAKNNIIILYIYIYIIFGMSVLWDITQKQKYVSAISKQRQKL